MEPAAETAGPPPLMGPEDPPVPLVPRDALSDGRLDLLVIADEQALDPSVAESERWPAKAGSIIEDRRTRAGRPLATSVRVHGGPGFTMRDAWDGLGLALEPLPDLVVVALGWHDGGPGPAQHAPPEARFAASWLSEGAGAAVLPPDEGAPAIPRFYLRNDGLPRLLPEEHVLLQDALQRRLGQRQRPVVFVEVPVRHEHGPRHVLAATGGKLRPWISTVQGMEMAGAGPLFAGEGGPRLSLEGHAQLGMWVGMGLLQFLPDP
jgi:hypothetical protein